MMPAAETDHELKTRDDSSRAHRIRTALPGQMLRERIDLTRASYGRLYTMVEIRRRVAETLPQRIGYVRGAACEAIETYQEPIPDEALLKYDDAARSGLFDKFLVVTPTYYREHQLDPWIVGQVMGADLYAVVAQWDV